MISINSSHAPECVVSGTAPDPMKRMILVGDVRCGLPMIIFGWSTDECPFADGASETGESHMC